MYSNYDHIFYFNIASESRVLETISSNLVRQEKSYMEISKLNELTYDVWSKYPSIDVIPQQPTVKDKAMLTARRINEYVGEDIFIINDTDHMFE